MSDAAREIMVLTKKDDDPSVLHNVGNVLNSVNVPATVMVDQLRCSALVDFPPAVQLLHEHTADLGAFLMHDPRGRLLPAFLTLLAEHWSRERAAHAQGVRGPPRACAAH